MASIVNEKEDTTARVLVYKGVSNEQLSAMSDFCTTTLEKNNYHYRVKAAIIVQRNYRNYYYAESQVIKRKNTYSIRISNFLEQGCAISALSVTGNVPCIASFHKVPSLVMQTRCVCENDEILSSNGSHLLGLDYAAAVKIVMAHRKQLSEDGTPIVLRLRRKGKILKVMFQHFQLPLGIDLIANPKVVVPCSVKSQNMSLGVEIKGTRARARQFMKRVVSQLSKSNITTTEETVIDTDKEPETATYSKMDIRNLSPIIIGPLQPVRGAIEESGVDVGDQIVYIENHGSTLSKSYTNNLQALVNTTNKPTLVVFQRHALPLRRPDVLRALDAAKRRKLSRETVPNGKRKISRDNTEVHMDKKVQLSSDVTGKLRNHVDMQSLVKTELKNTGIQVLKHPRKGKPEQRLIWLSEDESRLEIGRGNLKTSATTRKGLRLDAVLLILKGLQSDVFKRTEKFVVSEKLCFSLVIAGRTYDFELLCSGTNNNEIIKKCDTVVTILQQLSKV